MFKLLLKEAAPENISRIVVTDETSHVSRLLLKAAAPLNIDSIVVTRPVSQRLRSALNVVAPAKAFDMSVTRRTSHRPMSPYVLMPTTGSETYSRTVVLKWESSVMTVA